MGVKREKTKATASVTQKIKAVFLCLKDLRNTRSQRGVVKIREMK